MKSLVLFFIRCYRWFISPLFVSQCRYVPSCSVYAIETIQKKGVFKGGRKVFQRICSCHPFASRFHFDSFIDE